MMLLGILALIAGCVGAILYSVVLREVSGWSINGKNGEEGGED